MSKKRSIKSLTALVEKYEVIVEKQQAEISTLMVRVKTLEDEIVVLKNKKNSSNSHVPPSVDLTKPKRNQSLREKSGKKPGGQKGHEGSTLAFSAFPDEIITHIPDYCHHCGDDLVGVRAIELNNRQVIDIPMPAPICTEHQTFSKTCSCGHVNKGEFPVNVKAKVQYGENIEALTAYLSVRQYLPFARIQEFYAQAMGLKISQGSIASSLQRFAAKAMPMYLEIKERVQMASCIGTDETGAKINGKLNWFWTWQNAILTFIVNASSRGFITIEETFANGLPNALLVHDRWAAHFKCESAGHQICLAHLLRDLNYIHQVHQNEWALSLKSIISEAIELSNEAGYDGLLPNIHRDKLEESLNGLLLFQLPEKDKLAITLQKQLRKISGFILCFLHYNDVPGDNNGSERAIRNIKVKQKISGGFRSDQGADAFAVIRSVIDTTIKTGQNVLDALTLIART